MSAYNTGPNPIGIYRRQLAGLTQEQLAAQAGMTPEYLNRLEKGEQPRFTARLRPLADIFGVPVEELVGRPPH
jgi:transcriptional regulator with XRE-family HTH domain